MPEVQESVLGSTTKESVKPKYDHRVACRAYYRNNRTRILAQNKAYALAHKEAKAAYHKAYRAKHREKACAYATAYRKKCPERWHHAEIKARYGIRAEEYAAMFNSQDGRCKICGTTTPGKRFKRFGVDHCHDSGKIRGLLCSKCNSGIGFFDHDPARLLAAIVYLKGCGFLGKEKPQTH